MTSPVITNSLLRINGVTGEPPSPFERPNKEMDFFVLELGLNDDVVSWCARTEEVLSKHTGLLRQMREAGAEATLFVGWASSVHVLRLDSAFLSVLTEAEISLECFHQAA
jgi:hypothetical protein